MRLELREIGGQAPAIAGQGKWYFERGRRTVGRSADCDWQVPAECRSISKLHCTIESDRDGFILKDQSANGSRVDGAVVHEGESIRLSDRAELQIGNLSFSVRISGELDREMEDPDAGLALSDERLTISAILSDIAPGGKSANGILGSRQVDDWPETKPVATTSRSVEIGWSGPPEIASATKLLPENWNSENESVLGSQLEHGSATHVAVPVTRVRHQRGADTVNDNTLWPEPPKQPSVPQDDGGREDQALLRWIERMDDALEASFALFDLDPPENDSSDARSVPSRLEGLLQRQLALNSALAAMLRNVSQQLEPRLIEARTDTAARRLPWNKDGAYWQNYRAQFDEGGVTLSVRDVLRAAMTADPEAGPGKLTALQKGNADEE